MQFPEPQAEHAWLQQLVGEWTAEMEMTMAPGQPPVRCKGVDRVRSLGGLWVIGEGEVPGGGIAHNVMTLGFDPRTGRFAGTFVASVMTHLWVYDGGLDAQRKKLTLDCEGPSMAEEGGTLAKYQDAIEIVSPAHRVLTSRIRLPDGSWNQFHDRALPAQGIGGKDTRCSCSPICSSTAAARRRSGSTSARSAPSSA
jgi:hypothetical protein